MAHADETKSYEGRYFRGRGDVEFFQLLDISRRMFAPDPEFQSLPMLYTPAWNGMVEGPTWGAWWIQNSYGPTYCALPFLQEPMTTFIQNAQDLWFDQMGDGRTLRPHKHGEQLFNWVPPDGCLCDAANPGWFVAKQGDGRVDIHDWGMEFTAAGLVLQAELLLIGRDAAAIARYLPKLERVANFVESRRDPSNNLFLAGPAGNLLAPSYAGWKKPDGTFDKAYLAGLSITYIAGLDRLVELEKFAGHTEKARLYSERRELARKGLAHLTTDEGYLIKYLDPDGTRHGVYGAAKHGYFEAVCNHDAICFRVVDDGQSRKIYEKMAAIPGLRPHDLILTNYPTLDDMYEPLHGIWNFGTWVNGGHWTTCEARMIVAYYRLAKHEDARRAMKKILSFARQFRLDNPLVKCGGDVYQPKQPINTVYDCWGAPAAMVRGLFEYIFTADGLRLFPHLPPGITALEQRFPIRFGKKRIYLSAAGTGDITGVVVNGTALESFDAHSVFLTDAGTPDMAKVTVLMGGEKLTQWPAAKAVTESASAETVGELPEALAELDERVQAIKAFQAALEEKKLGNGYEAAHAQLAIDWVSTIHDRRRLQREGKLQALSQPVSQEAAEQLYLDTGAKLCDGLAKTVQSYGKSEDPAKREIFRLWQEKGGGAGWHNIRALGQKQSFRHREGGMRMTLSGDAESSCGWALDLLEPAEVPEGSQLVVEISGSVGAKFFVDVLKSGGGIAFQTLWQATPQERKEIKFALPGKLQLGQVIVYTMTSGGEVHNDCHRLAVESPAGKTLLSLLPAPKRH